MLEATRIAIGAILQAREPCLSPDGMDKKVSHCLQASVQLLLSHLQLYILSYARIQLVDAFRSFVATNQGVPSFRTQQDALIYDCISKSTSD